jgi:hypothetical protein
MSDNDPKNDSAAKNDGSADNLEPPFTGRRGMGGPIGGRGYRFQDRYTVARIPKLLSDPSFVELLPEGAEDLDIKYSDGKVVRHEYIQIKNHNVEKPEFRDIVENFLRVNKNMSGGDVKFWLACSSLGSGVRTLADKLKRYRDVRDFYKDSPEDLATTLADVKESIENFGLANSADLIINRLFFHTNLPAFDEHDVVFSWFNTDLLKLPEYSEILTASGSVLIESVKRVFTDILILVVESNGKILDRNAIVSCIKNALKGASVKLPRPQDIRPQRDLSTFVNRASEVWNFRRMNRAGQRPIMIVTGEEGIGKSELVYKMVEVCARRNIKNSAVVWTDLRFYDYVGVMCKIRDAISNDCFGYFSQLVAEQRTNRDQSEEYHERGALTGLNGPSRSELAQQRMGDLTEAFVLCLAEATKDDKVIILLDYAEKITEETSKWIWGGLFMAAADGKLPNVRFVLCAERAPKVKLDLLELVRNFELQPFTRRYIVKYLKKRLEKENLHVEEQRLDGWVDVISLDTRCYPADIKRAASKLIDFLAK